MRTLRDEARPTRDNPSLSLFGVSLEDLIITGIGGAGVNWASNSLALPAAKQVFPIIPSANDTKGQLVDAGATCLTAGLAGLGIEKFLSKRVGKDVLYGGLLLGVMKGVTAFIPNIALNSEFPGGAIFGRFGVGAGPKPAVAAPSSPAALSAPAPSGHYPPFTSYPRPVDANQNVGL